MNTEISYEKILDLDLETKQTLTEIIISTFKKFIAPDFSEEGIETFYKFIGEGLVLEETLKNRDIIFVAKYENQIVGLIATRSNHISLLFIDERFHGRKISKHLFDIIKSEIKEEFITVNSSPYAEKIYEKLGFIKGEDMKEMSGIKFIPMKYLKNWN